MRGFTYSAIRRTPATGGTAVALAASLWATANPNGFSEEMQWQWDHLNVGDLGLFILVAILLYLSLLWLSRDWHKTDRDAYQEQLGKIFDDLADWQGGVVQAPSDVDLQQRMANVHEVLAQARNWILANMGPRALRKFEQANRTAHSYPWPGDHDPDLVGRRSQMIDRLHDYQANVEALMESGAWDDPVSLSRRQWQQRRKDAKSWVTQKIGLTPS